MGKNKRWHLGLILTVLAVTLYNILPTLFFYCKPLNKEIDPVEGAKIQNQILARLDDLSEEQTGWIRSFCKELKISDASIHPSKANPDVIQVDFKTDEEANRFRYQFTQAAHSIHFEPLRLNILNSTQNLESKTILLTNSLALMKDLKSTMHFQPIKDEKFSFNPHFIDQKLSQLKNFVDFLIQPKAAQLAKKALEQKESELNWPVIDQIAQDIHALQSHVSNQKTLKRLFASFSQGNFEQKTDLSKAIAQQIDLYRDQIKMQKVKIQEEENQLKEEGKTLSKFKKEQLAYWQNKEDRLLNTTMFLKKHRGLMTSAETSAKPDEATQTILNNLKFDSALLIRKANLFDLNPFIESIDYDWQSQTVYLHPYLDLMEQKEGKLEANPILIEELNRIGSLLNQTITQTEDRFAIPIGSIENPSSLLKIDLKALSNQAAEKAFSLVHQYWTPASPILLEENKLSIVSGYNLNPTKPGSLYCVIKGGSRLLNPKEEKEESTNHEIFLEDLTALQKVLQSFDFNLIFNSPFESDDLVFECPHFFSLLQMAMRENFVVSIDQSDLELYFTDLKQRIVTLNKVETAIHEELIKWKNDYFRWLNHPERQFQPIIPKPTKNLLVSNFLLSAKKYFRGDERKVIKWGLDLSGGKSVELAIFDKNDQRITAQDELKLASNELYQRVNKLGVSEVVIRQEGDHLTLDFPGSQAFSAHELIQASSMTFHVVNEPFSDQNFALKEDVDRFLQDVWNLASIHKKQDSSSLNQIAADLLYGEGRTIANPKPKTESAKVLFEKGLRIGHSDSSQEGLDLAFSKIVPFRLESKNKTAHHPLLIVFSTPALEGSHLAHVQSGFDPQEGNFLSFEVKKEMKISDQKTVYPQSQLASWTEKFSKDAVQSAEFEPFSLGRGYRMAVVLNGEIVSAPTLNAAIKENGRITGHFSLSEVMKLQADLKTGSMTFKPKILSEKNISPELGEKEKSLGILATLVALISVIAIMAGYYRFSGVVASIAVILNLLIMWAILQNIQATLTLAGLAGIVLTVGMAVDANVLVFERIKEELKIHENLKIALENGYQKAFSAIIDSNLTTILAALVLLNFDSGPVKGFALTLIIGVVSSMFTSLFLTRYIFRLWIEKFQLRSLNMLRLFESKKISFVRYFKPALTLSGLLLFVAALSITTNRHSLLGMDFTGGYAVEIKLDPSIAEPCKGKIESALSSLGLDPKDFSVRQLSLPFQAKLFISKNAESFFSSKGQDGLSAIQNSLKKAGFNLSSEQLLEMEKSWTQVSGQMSQSMKNQALIGIVLALIGILIYISFRFEFKYALAATINLALVIGVTFSIVAILNRIQVQLLIDLNMIAAFLTIIGYSLNDTIIVFDRIREDSKRYSQFKLGKLADSALNATLSRTLMTSGTTLIVLIALCALGGSSIFSFSFVMAVGVLIGTVSTFYLAVPLLSWIDQKFDKKKTTLSIITT